MKKPSLPQGTLNFRKQLLGLLDSSPVLRNRFDRLERFRALLDHANDIILLVRLDSRQIVDANASACRQLGYPSETLVGMPVEKVVDFESLEWPEDVEGGGECRTIATRLRCRKGAPLPVEMLFCMEEFGDAPYVVIVARDITERLRAEEVLRRSEWEKALILDSTRELVIFHDRDMRIVWANRTAAESVHMTSEGLKGLYCWELWHQRQAPCDKCPVLRAIRTGQPHEAEITTQAGRVWFVRSYPARNAAGEIEGAVELGLDITKRKRAEEALRESEERFRSVFEHAASGMTMFSLDGRFLQVNPALCRFLGYSEAELLNLRVEDVTDPDDRERMHRFYNELRTGIRKAFDYEKRYIRKDGSFVWGHATVAQVRNSGAQPDYYVGMVQDITDGKLAEDALRESDRMKTEFISTAAHELRTPLTSILGFSQVLLSQENLSAAEQRESLNYIHQQARALSDMVADLLDIARIESGQGLALNLEASSPAALAQLLEPFLQGASCRSCHCQLDLHGERTPLRVDKGKMIQVFENLLSNAVKYSPEGSSIRITGEVSNEGYRFSVADQGVGMTAEQVARVFDKFYRADASDTARGGLGLGMSIAKNIVESHGGRIWVESEPGRGTTVRFTLPLDSSPRSGKESDVEENPDRR